MAHPNGFEIGASPIDPDALKRALEAGAAGACVCFEGWVRNVNDGEDVEALEYETHPEIARVEGNEVLAEASAKFDVTAVRCVHRVGRLAIGECAVWVGVSAGHRGAAFDACRYIIDEIKHRLPIWKKEHYRSGASGWINCATGAAAAAPLSADPASR
jgi:molybdopterin synthase catalytic subunit